MPPFSSAVVNSNSVTKSVGSSAYNREVRHSLISIVKPFGTSRVSSFILRVGLYVAFWILLAVPAIARMTRTSLACSGVVFFTFLISSLVLDSEELLKRFKSKALLLLLLVAPIIPFFESDLLRVMLASFVVFEIVTSRIEIHRWSWPIVVLCGGIMTGALWSVVIDRSQLLRTFTGIPLTSFPSLALVMVPVWQPVAEIVVVVLLIGAASNIVNRRSVQWMLTAGALIGALFTVLQKHAGGELGILLKNQSSFWSSIHRLPGSFSDPNAQGIYLCIALIFGVFPVWNTVRLHANHNWLWRLVWIVTGVTAIALLGYAVCWVAQGRSCLVLGCGLLLASCCKSAGLYSQ